MSAAGPAHDAELTSVTDDNGSDLRRLRRPAFVAGIVGLLLLALLVWALSGDGSPEMTPAADEVDDGDVVEPESEIDTEVDGADEFDALPTVTYEVYLARDPFDPVVPEDDPDVPDPADPDDPDPDDPDPDGPDPEGPDPDDPDPDDPDPVDPDDPDPADPDECLGEEEVVCNGQVVSLMDVIDEADERVAVVQVDTTVYEVRSGETFAERYRLLSIGDGQVEALFGDTRFTLMLGEAVMK